MALTKIPSSLLDTSGGITLGDNDKAIFGAGSDLQIYHDGSHSIITDQGTGSLLLRGTAGVFIQNAEGTENIIAASADGAVTLYHDNSSKLATTSTGATVTGDLAVTGDLNITGNVNSASVTDLDVTDKTITLGAGQTEALSGGSGIIIDGSSASLLWDETNDEWDFNKDINVTGKVVASNWYQGASSTNTLYSSTSQGTIIQTPSNTNNAAGTFYIRDSLGNVHLELNTNTNVVDIAGTISSGAITSTGIITSQGVASLNDAQIGRINFTNTNSNASSNPIRASIFAGRQTSAWGGYLSLYTSTGTDAATEKVRIGETGDINVGTTSKNNSYPARFITTSLATPSSGEEACHILELVGRRNQNAGNQNGMIQFWNTTSTPAETARISGIQGTALNSGALIFATYAAGTYGEAMRIDQSGKVGIGTNSPLSVTKGLHVVHANNEGNPTYTGAEVGIFQRNFNSSQGAAISIVGGSNSESTVNFADKDDANIGQINYQHSSNSMLFRTNDTVQLSMSNTGKMIIAPAGNITKSYRTLFNGTSTAVQYIKLYEKSGTTPNKHLHFQMYSENNSEHSVEVKIMLPTYSGFLTNYGAYDEGQGPHVEIIAGGLTSQANTFKEIIAVADMSSTNDYTEIWLKIDPVVATTAVSIAEFPHSEVITATTSDWTTTAPSNIQKRYPIVTGQHSINNVQIGQDSNIALYNRHTAGSNTIDSNTIILTKYAAGNADANQNENTDDIYFTEDDFGFPNSAYGVNVVGYFYASNRLSGVSSGSSGHIWRVAGSLDSGQQVAMSMVNEVDQAQSFGGGTALKIIGSFNSTIGRFEFGVTWEYGAGGYGTVTFIGQATEAMG